MAGECNKPIKQTDYNRRDASDTHLEYVWESEKKKHSSFYYAACGFVGLLIVLVAVVPVLVSCFGQIQSKKEKAVNQVAEAKRITLGEPCTYEIHYSDFQTEEEQTDYYDITITNVAYDTDTKLDVPEGYQLVAVSYKINANQGLLDGGGQSWYTGQDIISDIYLKTKDGSFLKPLPFYEIDDIKGIDLEECHQKGISQQLEYQNGIVIFLVQRDDISSLLINFYDYPTEKNKPVILQQKYEICDLEVE